MAHLQTTCREDTASCAHIQEARGEIKHLANMLIHLLWQGTVSTYVTCTMLYLMIVCGEQVKSSCVYYQLAVLPAHAASSFSVLTDIIWGNFFPPLLSSTLSIVTKHSFPQVSSMPPSLSKPWPVLHVHSVSTKSFLTSLATRVLHMNATVST